MSEGSLEDKDFRGSSQDMDFLGNLVDKGQLQSKLGREWEDSQ